MMAGKRKANHFALAIGLMSVFPIRRKRATIFALAFLLALFLGAPQARILQAQNNSADEAAAIGVARKADITIGEGYVTRVESIEARITVLEVRRGEKAWDLVKTSGLSDKPAAGMEYVAARIRFEYGAQGASEDPSYAVRGEQFASVSGMGGQYDRPSVLPPKPELSGWLYPGDSLEGWLVFFVSVGDEKPLMSFGNNYNKIWFRLY
jgi:hypothetical protein